jgi:hypothetical protein
MNFIPTCPGMSSTGAITTAKEMGIYTAGHIPFQLGLEGVLSNGLDEITHIEKGP